MILLILFISGSLNLIQLVRFTRLKHLKPNKEENTMFKHDEIHQLQNKIRLYEKSRYVRRHLMPIINPNPKKITLC